MFSNDCGLRYFSKKGENSFEVKYSLNITYVFSGEHETLEQC